MGTLFYKHKIVKTENIDELYKNGGDDKYIIPICKGSSWTEKELKDANDGNFITLINLLDDTEIEDYLDFHYNNFNGDKKSFIANTKLIMHKEDVQNNYLTMNNEYKKLLVEEWIEEKKQKPNEPETNPKPKKIKWNGKPSHLAYILKNLTVNMELPPEILNNKSETAKYFLNFFEVNSPDSFIRLYQNDNLPTHAIKQDLNKLIVDPSSKND